MDSSPDFHQPWLPDWYVRRLQPLDRVRKLKLEKRLIFGYTAFGVCFGLLQYTGMGSLPPAISMSEWVGKFIPMVETAGRFSPYPDGARFYYSVMWLVALASTALLVPLSTDLHSEEMPARIKKYPVRIFLFIPFFLFCVGAIFLGGTQYSESLGNSKLYDNYISMALYGSVIMTTIPWFLASSVLIIRFWREITQAFVRYCIRSTGR